MSQAEETIKKAIQETEDWSKKGWHMDFGPKRVPVCNLEEAEKLSGKFSFKKEAVAYWNKVKLTSEDAAKWGNQALEAVKKGDLKDAYDCVYFAMIVEKPINEKAPTWTPSLNSLN